MDEETTERNPDPLLNSQWEEKRITTQKEQTPCERLPQKGRREKKSFREGCFCFVLET